MNKYITVLIIIIGSYFVYNYYSKPWQLSLYGDGVTLMRLNYDSKNSCLSAGSSYYGDGYTQYKRFDCGYKCNYVGDENDLTNSPVCSKICDSYGCK